MKGVSIVDRKALFKHLMILDFMALDLGLYINTHPDDMEIIEMYNQVVINADKCRYNYEKHFGPLTSFRSLQSPEHMWEALPWPWCKAQA